MWKYDNLKTFVVLDIFSWWRPNIFVFSFFDATIFWWINKDVYNISNSSRKPDQWPHTLDLLNMVFCNGTNVLATGTCISWSLVVGVRYWLNNISSAITNTCPNVHNTVLCIKAHAGARPPPAVTMLHACRLRHCSQRCWTPSPHSPRPPSRPHPPYIIAQSDVISIDIPAPFFSLNIFIR